MKNAFLKVDIISMLLKQNLLEVKLTLGVYLAIKVFNLTDPVEPNFVLVWKPKMTLNIRFFNVAILVL